MKNINYNNLFKKYSAKSQRNVFTGNHSKILNKFNLKKFGGPNDFDFDGIINKKDCNPFSSMRQDFTPFRDSKKAEQMTAAKRFGGQNLKGLKQIGQGRDRVVYALDKDKVLKVAKNPGGLTQNTSESDLEFLGMGKHYETGLDYSVMSRNKPLSQTNKKKLAKVRKEVNNLSGRDIYYLRSSEEFSGDNNVLDETGIGKDVLNYNFNPTELFANRQWGEDDQGELALNDGGALQDGDSLSKFRVKDFEDTVDPNSITGRVPWQLEDWRETQNQRKNYKNKGTYKPRNMDRDGKWPEQPEALQSLELEDDNSSKNKYEEELQEYITQPLNNKGKGRCANAAQCVVNTALKEGAPLNDIDVYGLTINHPFKDNTSQHVIAKVNNKYYDPTRTQYGKYDDYEFDNLEDTGYDIYNVKKLNKQSFIQKQIQSDEESKNKSFFHQTDKKNIESIKEKGLIESFAPGGRGVWLRPNKTDYLFKHQAEIEVDIPLEDEFLRPGGRISKQKALDNPEDNYYFTDNTKRIGNWLYENNIPPDRIINIRTDNISDDEKSKNMARFSAAEENEILDIDWNKSQKGTKLGEGHFAEVFEVKDNPKFVLKVPKDKQGSYHGSTKEEINKFDLYGDNKLIAPSFETSQGIVREKLNIISRGATKQDWDNKDKRVSGYSFFEKDNITKDQAKQVVDGVNELSDNNVLIDDELQIGINSKGTPYMFDIGTLRNTKNNNYDGYARDENDQYKQRFLKGVNQENLFDRDYEAESKQAQKEIMNISDDEESKNNLLVPLPNFRKGPHKISRGVDGTKVHWKTSKKIPARKFMSEDDIGYELDNLPFGLVPSNVDIWNVPRSKKGGSWNQGVNAKKETDGHYQHIRYDEETEDYLNPEIRLYPTDWMGNRKDLVDFSKRMFDRDFPDLTEKQKTRAAKEYANTLIKKGENAYTDEHKKELKKKLHNKRVGNLHHELGHALSYDQIEDYDNTADGYKHSLKNNNLEELKEKNNRYNPVILNKFSKDVENKNHPTKYAEKNRSEDFAESYSISQNKHPNKKREDLSQDRQDFFDKYYKQASPKNSITNREVIEKELSPESLMDIDLPKDELGEIDNHTFWRQTRYIDHFNKQQHNPVPSDHDSMSNVSEDKKELIQSDEESKNMAYVKHMSPNEETDEYLLKRFQDLEDYPKTVKLYHGTRLKHANKIKKEGLKSQATTGNRNFGNIDSRYTDKVYLTQNKSSAMWWATQNKDDGEAVILEVDVPFEDYRKGLDVYKERYNEDSMVRDEDRDELLLNDIPSQQIKKIIPYSNAVIQKELNSEVSLNNLDREKNEKINAENRFREMFKEEQ